MTNQQKMESICTMLHEYDLHTGNRAAEGVIANPEKWLDSAYFPFYAAAAEMLIEVRASMDKTISKSGTLAAIRRIAKNCNREDMRGIFQQGGRFCICDGYRLLRLNTDISSIPHVETNFDAERAMGDSSENPHPLQLPSIADLKAWISDHKTRFGKSWKPWKDPYILTYGDGEKICVNAQYLIDMLQALPGCTAAVKSPVSPIYFSAENGDGVLLPVRLESKQARAGEKKAA